MELKSRRVLYLSYNGMLDPLGQSQVLPYLRELSREEGVQFTLLSFEREGAFAPEGSARAEGLRRELEGEGIEWHWLRYHQKPSLPATLYDVLAGVRYGERLVQRKKIELVHARAHIAGTIALALKKRFRLKMIFDVRGLMAEEYVDANHWRKGGVPYILTKAMERRVLRASDGIVTLTERIWPILKNWEGLRGRTPKHEVIPCCTNLELFEFDPKARREKRAELGLKEQQFLLVYSGSIGGWYLTAEMADFFAELLKQRADAHFLWLTLGPRELVDRLMSERGISTERYTVVAARSANVPLYLSASDAGIAFYKPGLSRLATSPVKVTEYLACGLPFVINAGVGDTESLVGEEETGALVQEFSAGAYERAAQALMSLTEDAEGTRVRLRETARRLFDVRGVGRERYARLYGQVFGGA